VQEASVATAGIARRGSPEGVAHVVGLLLYADMLIVRPESPCAVALRPEALEALKRSPLVQVTSVRGAGPLRQIEARLDGRLSRLLMIRGSLIQGLPPSLVTGSIKDSEATLRGALTSAPPRENGRSFVVRCASTPRALALVGLLRRCGFERVSSSSAQQHTVVRIDASQGTRLTTLGLPLPAGEHLRPESRRGAPSVLEAVNDVRRASQKGRTWRALEILGESCPPHLREAAELRLQYPDESLEALGQRMDPPASRHVVCGQLRRLERMAEGVRPAV
jgi:hypothetical protein